MSVPGVLVVTGPLFLLTTFTIKPSQCKHIVVDNFAPLTTLHFPGCMQNSLWWWWRKALRPSAVLARHVRPIRLESFESQGVDGLRVWTVPAHRNLRPHDESGSSHHVFIPSSYPRHLATRFRARCRFGHTLRTPGAATSPSRLCRPLDWVADRRHLPLFSWTQVKEVDRDPCGGGAGRGTRSYVPDAIVPRSSKRSLHLLNTTPPRFALKVAPTRVFWLEESCQLKGFSRAAQGPLTDWLAWLG